MFQEKKAKSIEDRIWTVKCALNGLGALFTLGHIDVALKGDDFYGIGLLLEGLAEELSSLLSQIKAEDSPHKEA